MAFLLVLLPFFPNSTNVFSDPASTSASTAISASASASFIPKDNFLVDCGATNFTNTSDGKIFYTEPQFAQFLPVILLFFSSPTTTLSDPSPASASTLASFIPKDNFLINCGATNPTNTVDGRIFKIEPQSAQFLLALILFFSNPTTAFSDMTLAPTSALASFTPKDNFLIDCGATNPTNTRDERIFKTDP